ncbi:hypothetical protein ACQKIE_12075 [Luteibacter sp. NPDC031894]|uniref:hypothetical protein n=1 Tax=Luteibacter sp. NPDC031894 TaxID=3390572 RepID=UPI003D001736
MTVRDELERVIENVRLGDDSNEAEDYVVGQDSAFYFILDHGPALLEAVVDAERWRKVRNAPIGVAGTPCIAVPSGPKHGEYANGEDADAAVDGMPYPEPSTLTIDSIRELIVPFEIAHNICGPDTEYAKGYGDACGDIVHSVTNAIDRARGGGE